MIGVTPQTLSFNEINPMLLMVCFRFRRITLELHNYIKKVYLWIFQVNFAERGAHSRGLSALSAASGWDFISSGSKSLSKSGSTP